MTIEETVTPVVVFVGIAANLTPQYSLATDGGNDWALKQLHDPFAVTDSDEPSLEPCASGRVSAAATQPAQLVGQPGKDAAPIVAYQEFSLNLRIHSGLSVYGVASEMSMQECRVTAS